MSESILLLGTQLLLPSFFYWSLFLLLLGLSLGFILGWAAKPRRSSRTAAQQSSPAAQQSLPQGNSLSQKQAATEPKSAARELTSEPKATVPLAVPLENQVAASAEPISADSELIEEAPRTLVSSQGMVRNLERERPASATPHDSAHLPTSTSPAKKTPARSADPDAVIQSRQPVAKPLGEIERRRQRFEEAQREAEQKNRK